MSDTEYNITLFETCEILNKSKKTISRYIRRGILKPQQIKSQQGTLEYRFSKTDLETLRVRLARVDTPDRTDQTEETGHEGQTRQDTQTLEKTDLGLKQGGIALEQDQTGQSRQDRGDTGDRTDRTRETGHNEEIITLLKETTELLKSQLTVKDTQIATLNNQVQQLIERGRETNILLMRLQEKVLLLEPPKERDTINAGETGRDRTRRGKPDRARLLTLLFLLLVAEGVYLLSVLPDETINRAIEYIMSFFNR